MSPYLAETDTQSRLEWVAALDKLEALKPRAVIAGHKIRKMTTIPATSRRRGNISAISTASMKRRQPRANSTTLC